MSDYHLLFQYLEAAVRILLIGSRRGINSIIHWLYRLGFAEVAAWSKQQIAPNSEDQQMMSITVKQVTLD
ncbi:hypothetical protein ACX27_02070 [Nostoc piscinale CENA21]|uniref:Uncharacterized protein n=1 Tax=Nostoc piscinale CENA21 TaxID=224013 RepID=A0A0M4SWE9_9NOSO|nr:hypothetical protein ACX27_02070 [Nostoc piscinale CENA21]